MDNATKKDLNRDVAPNNRDNDHPQTKIPGQYWIWLSGATVTTVGSQIIGFGLVWIALGSSTWLASTILVAEVTPRVLLALLGGSLSDSRGPKKIMLWSAAVFSISLVVYALLFDAFGSSAALLLCAGVTIGVVDAFYVPASGSVPKYLVSAEHLPRAMAARQFVAQASVLVGPALGGVVIQQLGLVPSLFIGSCCYAAMLVLLCSTKIEHVRGQTQVRSGSLWQDAVSGLREVMQNNVARILVLLTGAFAGFVIPLTSFFIPMLVRESTLGADASGLLVSSYSAGMLTITLLVFARGRANRPGATAAVGILLAGLSITSLCIASEYWGMIVLCLLAGVGSGLFATCMGPLFMASIPVEAIGRAQATMMLAQSLPLIASNFLIATSETIAGVQITVSLWGTGPVFIGLVAIAQRDLRNAALPNVKEN